MNDIAWILGKPFGKSTFHNPWWRSVRRRFYARLMVRNWKRGAQSWTGDSYVDWLGVGNWAEVRYWFYLDREVPE